MPETLSVTDNSPVSITVQRLLDLRHSLQSGDSMRPEGTGLFIGAFRGMKRGQGTDYDDLREYTAGDDIRHIDWRASARTQQLQTRLYREETEHRIQLFVDLRDCMYTGSEQLRSVTAGLLAGRILWQACSGGSRVNTIVLSNDGLKASGALVGVKAAICGCSLLANEFHRVQLLVKAKQHGSDTKNQTTSALNNSSTQQPDEPEPPIPYPQSPTNFPTVGPQSPTLAQALQWQIEQPSRHTANLWVSGMDLRGEQFAKYLNLLSHRHATAFVIVEDPIETSPIAAGKYHYYSEHQQRQSIVLDESLREQLQLSLKQQRQQIIETFDAAGVPVIDTSHGYQHAIDGLRFLGHLP